MELLFGVELIYLLQHLLSPSFDRVFEAVTLLGNDAILVGLTATVYWCFDKRRGKLVTYILFFSAYMNFFLKAIVPSPRPPVDLRITEKGELGNGFPSGHAQDASAFWTGIVMDTRNRWAAYLSALIVFVVGVSRIYLGVHYPVQALGGWIIGFAIAVVVVLVARHFSPVDGGSGRLSHQLFFAFGTLIFLMIAVALGAGGERNLGQVAGYLFAFALGAIVEDRYVRFKAPITNVRRIIRLAIGAVMVGLVVFALGPILPMTQLVPAFANSFARGMTVVLVAPWIFKLVERS